MSPKMKSMTQEYLRVFLATSLALFLADAADIASLAKLYINAGLASVLPVILRALNPNDGEFGKVRSIEE
jgi:hypothetical protein